MLSRLIPTALIVLLLAVLAPAQGLADKKVHTIRMATVAPDGSPWHDSLQRIEKRWSDDSDGRLRLRSYLGGALGDENQTIAETRRGQIQMVGASIGAVGSLIPEVNVLELPFLFRNEAEADHILDNVIGDDLNEIFKERGFVLLMWSENGFRHWGTKFGHIKKPSDLRGRQMRAQENTIHLNTYRALGATPVPIPTTEAIPALQTGVVQGFDQTPLFGFATGMHNQSTHWTVSDHIYQPGAILINRSFFEGLPDDLQKIMLKDAHKEAQESRAGIRALTPLLVQNLSAAGLDVYHITEDERKAFVEAVQPVYEEFVRRASPRAKALYEKITAGLEEYRANNP